MKSIEPSAYMPRHREPDRSTAPTRRNAATAAAPAVQLHIAELSLDGFPPLDQDALAAAVGQELNRLLAAHGVPARLAAGGHLESLAGPTAEIDGRAEAAEIGVQIAQAIYKGFAP